MKIKMNFPDILDDCFVTHKLSFPHARQTRNFVAFPIDGKINVTHRRSGTRAVFSRTMRQAVDFMQKLEGSGIDWNVDYRGIVGDAWDGNRMKLLAMFGGMVKNGMLIPDNRRGITKKGKSK